jgi:signal peptidase I
MKEFLKDLVIAVLVAFIILQFIKPTIVKESSMEPTLWENNYIILSKQAYTFDEPERGDIVVFHTDLKTDDGKEKLLIKRVIGLPGETLSIVDGNVYIDGELLDEPYIKNTTTGYIESLTIPEGQIFVMGDNREVSKDSRSEDVGCVDIDKIVGKAVIRLYPFDEITIF